LKMPFTYSFPRPSVTVDSVVLRPHKGLIEVLLIKRGHDPFAGFYALPGGFLEMDEEPKLGAARELFEETEVEKIPLEPLLACGQTGRDPRGRCVTLVFGALINGDELNPKGGDDASEASWFALKSLPTMAFDHERVLRQVSKSLYWQAMTAVIGKNYLKEDFQEEEFSALHKLVLADSPIGESALERGLRLNLIGPSSTPGFFRFIFSGYGFPDWSPWVW